MSTVPSTALGNAGRRQVMGPGRAGPVSLLILILTLELGGQRACSAGCARWLCWHGPQLGDDENLQFAYIPWH